MDNCCFCGGVAGHPISYPARFRGLACCDSCLMDYIIVAECGCGRFPTIGDAVAYITSDDDERDVSLPTEADLVEAQNA